MPKTEFTSVGPGVVVHVTKKAALINLEDHGEQWFPLSALDTATLASCKLEEKIDAVSVETWLADKL